MFYIKQQMPSACKSAGGKKTLKYLITFLDNDKDCPWLVTLMDSAVDEGCCVNQYFITSDIQSNGFNHGFILFFISLLTRIAFWHFQESVLRRKSKLGISAT